MVRDTTPTPYKVGYVALRKGEEMPHYLGPNRKLEVVTRKVFENFNRCDDTKAWDIAWNIACMEQRNDSWVEIAVGEVQDDSDDEYLRQWLLRNGATEEDGHVFLAISW